MDGEGLRVSFAQDVEHPAVFGHHEVTALLVGFYLRVGLLLLFLYVRLEILLPFRHGVVSCRMESLGLLGGAWPKPRGREAVFVNP